MTSPTYGRLVWLWVLLFGALAAGCSATADSEDVDSLSLAICNGSTVSASPSGPVNPGTAVTLTATAATCGAGETAEYRFLYKKIGAPGGYTEIQAYGPSLTANWDTTGVAAGQYDLLLLTRAVGSGVGAEGAAHRNFFINDVCTSATLSALPASPQPPGTMVALTAGASCNGAATPEFRFVYRLTTSPTWTEIQSWGGSTPTWNTTGLASGTYNLLVYARAAGNTSSWEAVRYLSYQLGGSCSAPTIATSPPSPQFPGTVVTITAGSTCDAGLTPEYRYYYMRPDLPNWFLIQDWTASTTAPWDTTGLPVGVQTVRLDVRAAQNGSGAEGVAYQQYTLSSAGGLWDAINVGMNYTTCGVVNDGTARCWGWNSDGQIGDGSKVDKSSPVTVSGLSSVSAVAPGGWHTCGLRTDGTARCWGLNSDGQLGTGTQTDSTIPVTVSGVANATAIASGTYHSCALISGGTVMCWGDNQFGQIGNGTFTGNVLTPITVTGVTGATAIAAGGWHTCALVAGGAIKCWGLNDVGQMGNGTTTTVEPSPVNVNISGATYISAGDSHNCALKSGQPQCWGLNTYGQLGNGTTTDSNVPVKVSLTQMTTVSAGFAHTCSRRYPDGTLRCWGDNSFGELGVVGIGSSTTPVTVTGITSATSAVAAGGVYSCSLQSNGSANCWGYNGFGQLGNGSTTDAPLPMPVNSP